MEHDTAVAVREQALKTIGLVRSLLVESAAPADRQEHLRRDTGFLDRVEDRVTSCDMDGLSEVIDEFRYLSQGFGSYVPDVDRLDHALDELYGQLTELLIQLRA